VELAELERADGTERGCFVNRSSSAILTISGPSLPPPMRLRSACRSKTLPVHEANQGDGRRNDHGIPQEMPPLVALYRDFNV
jgi:hypothetical protein